MKLSKSLTSTERLDDIFLTRFGVVAEGLLPMGDADGGEDIVVALSVLVVALVSWIVDMRSCM